MTDDGLEGMEFEDSSNEGRSQHGKVGSKVLVEDMLEGQLVVLVRFAHKSEVATMRRRECWIDEAKWGNSPFVTLFSFESLNLLFQSRPISGEGELFPIVKVDLVVRFCLST